LAASLRALPEANDVNILRGIEGEAARQYFAALNFLIRSDIREAFRMEGRNRRPPRDPINALLSFIYTLLMNDCRSAVEAVGLDPQIGFLHAIRPGRASLALDIMEEFRALADRLALSLINRGQIAAKDFVAREGGAVLLADDSRKTVLIAYQERKQEKLSHPLLHEPVALGVLPHLQARLLARTLRGDLAEYPPFLMR
jgi:CRISPR-associated protein Cas1